ncbi:MAG: methyl-accepting chemotaxis protein [Planctomycetota bacterium]
MRIELARALQAQKQAGHRLLSTPSFDVRLPAIPGNISLRDLYEHERSTHERLVYEYVDAMVASPPARVVCVAAAEVHREGLSSIERDIERRATNEPARAAMAAVLALALLLTVTLGFALWYHVRSRLGTLASRVQSMARGDLGPRLRIDGDDEVAATAAAFDTLLDRFDGTFGEVLAVATALDETNSTLRSEAQELSREASERTTSLQDAAACLQQLAAQSDHASEHTTTAGCHGQQAFGEAQKGADKTSRLAAAAAMSR